MHKKGAIPLIAVIVRIIILFFFAVNIPGTFLSFNPIDLPPNTEIVQWGGIDHVVTVDEFTSTGTREGQGIARVTASTNLELYTRAHSTSRTTTSFSGSIKAIQVID